MTGMRAFCLPALSQKKKALSYQTGPNYPHLAIIQNYLILNRQKRVKVLAVLLLSEE